MKKTFLFSSLFGLMVFSPLFAAEISITPVLSPSERLISVADHAIANGKITVGALLTTMQSIHETQKSDLQLALEKNDLVSAQKTLSQRSDMYALTTHLYDLEAGDGALFTNTEGTQYKVKQLASMSWLNLFRGDDQYYSFPQQDTFVEISAETQ